MPKRKEEEKKNDSGSSTPQSSPPSVDDDEKQLISSSSRKSRSDDKTKKTSEFGKFLDPGATSSRNAPEPGHSSKTDLLIPPDQESGTCSSKSPSKVKPLLKRSCAKSRSPNRSSDSKCSCIDKKKHQSECPELKDLAAKDRSRKGKLSSNESKPPYSHASPAKKSKVSTQSSSSSSDPSFPEKSLLTVPRESAPKSPSKMSRVMDFFKSKSKSPNRSSDAECSCQDKSDHELECPERRRQKTDTKVKSPKARSQSRCQTKSEESSSSGSPFPKKKLEGKSSESSENSQMSKLSSNSGHDPVESSSSNEGNRALESSSDNKSSKESKSDTASEIPIDNDPQEGSSSGPARDMLQRPNHPVPSRTKSHKTGHRILGSSHSLSPFRHSREGEDSIVGDANTERNLPASDSNEINRRVSRLAVGPDASVGRRHSSSPVRLRDCNCGRGNDSYQHKLGCSRMIDVRTRRKQKRCRQDVTTSKRYGYTDSEDDE